MKNVTEAVHAFIKACERENTAVELSFDTVHGIRPAVNVCVSSAFDGYLTADDIRFYYDHFNKCFGGVYSTEYHNVGNGTLIGWTPMYRGWYPLKKEVALALRLMRIIRKYGYQATYDAIRKAQTFTVLAF